jgi:hypothetical protein
LRSGDLRAGGQEQKQGDFAGHANRRAKKKDAARMRGVFQSKGLLLS